MNSPKNILISGASSGIGEALARQYAQPSIALAINGRDPARLEAVAAACREQGAAVDARPVDVADRAAIEAWIREFDERNPLDLIIANAGIGMSSSEALSLAETTDRTFAVNVQGVFNTVHPALERMKARGRGQIAIMSSIAGFVGMPGAVSYSASKAAVRSYGEGLRGICHHHGIGVSVICPGFVTTRMTARNRFRMPFLMDADRAARIIIRGLARNKGRIAFPWQTYAMVRLLQMLPSSLTDRLLRHSPTK